MKPEKNIEVATSLSTSRRLNQLKWTSLVVLVVSGIALLISILEGAHGLWPWVRAFAEAAIVGGLADWFAVTALFRKPMGLPIPHTAIIPRSKNRIADGLARFVKENFLEPSVLLDKVQAFDPASKLAGFLQDESRVKQLTELTRKGLLEGADWLNDPKIRESFIKILRNAIENWNAARTAGNLLTFVTRNERHQVLLDHVLEQVGDLLNKKEVKTWASERMVKMARDEWPTVIGMINTVKSVDGIADAMASKLGGTLTEYLAKILKNPEHELRKEFSETLKVFIQRLQEDADFGAYVDELKSKLLDSPAVNDYVAALFEDVKKLVLDQLASSETPLMRNVRGGIASIGSRIGNDPELQSSINKHILSGVEKLVADLQDSATSHISQTIKSWDERQIVETLEGQIGSDLQFIRLNGTLVGGLIGTLMHAAITFIPGIAG